MCKVMEDMRDQALAGGRAEGSLETLFSLVQDCILTPARAAERMGLTEGQFSEKLREVGLSH